MKRLTFLLAVIFALTSLNLVAFAGTPDKSPNLPPKRTQSTTPKTPTTIAVPADVKPVKFYKATVGKTYRLPADVRKTGDTYQTSNSAVLTVEETTGRFKSVSDGVAYIIATNGTAKRYIKVTVGTGTTATQQKPTASTGKSALAPYADQITITNASKLAVQCSGGGSTMYFKTKDLENLGSIPTELHNQITADARNKGVITHDIDERNIWIGEQFNLLRGLSSGGIEALKETTIIDTSNYTSEFAILLNQKRKNQGISQLAYDSSMQAMADTRAKELATLYSHERPDGTRLSKTHKYAEIISAGVSVSPPQETFEGFSASSRHNAIMMGEAYSSFAVGYYRAENGNGYWVGLFRW